MRGQVAALVLLFAAAVIPPTCPAPPPATAFLSPIRTGVYVPNGNSKGFTLRAGKGFSTSSPPGATNDVPSTPLSRARGVFAEPAFRKLLAPMGAAGAVLGPNLDNYHSAFGVLTYTNPVEISAGGHVLVTTDWW